MQLAARFVTKKGSQSAWIFLRCVEWQGVRLVKEESPHSRVGCRIIALYFLKITKKT